MPITNYQLLDTMLPVINKIKNHTLKQLIYITAVSFILIVILISSYLIFEKIYQAKIYPRTYLGNYNLSGLAYEQAEEFLKGKTNKINQDGISFTYQNKETNIMSTISSFEIDLAYEIISFNIEQTVNQAFKLGRGSNLLTNLQEKIISLLAKKTITMDYYINDAEIEKLLKQNYESFEIPANNANLIATSTKTTSGHNNIVFSVTKENIGKIIDYKEGVSKLNFNLKNLNFSPIELQTKTEYPTIFKDKCLNIESRAQTIISKAPLNLIFEDKKWIIEAEQLAGLLGLKKNEKNDIIVDIDDKKLYNFLKENISPGIDKEPINARFDIKNKKVTEFQGSRDGIQLDIPESAIKIKSKFLSNDFTATSTIKLITVETKSKITTENVNNLGIKEIIGTGYSNFSGSPANRRHNIETGAATINGLLIKPGEEFSLVKALGKVDASTGYLPELVIKGNKTIPEYGGGLCQIGTTMFRSAIASGLPITARSSHSYRVSYYEPAGTDAAVYDPWPDVRFINDTQKHILIQTRFDGNDLYFDFWGTKDGRTVNKTEPTIYNIVKPGPTKIVETLDLPVGEKKCTEHAHNGADAYFDYTVTYPPASATSTPVVKEKRFSSHYVPWQEVCLIGVEELSKNIEDENIDEKNNIDNYTATSSEE